MLAVLAVMAATLFAAQPMSWEEYLALTKGPSPQDGIGRFRLEGVEKTFYYDAPHALEQGAACEIAVVLVHGWGGGIRRAAAMAPLMRALAQGTGQGVAPPYVVAPLFPRSDLLSRFGSAACDLAQWNVSWKEKNRSVRGKAQDDWRGGGDAVGTTMSSYDVIDRIFAVLGDRERYPNLKRVVLSGFSAGGQFVGRYVAVGKGKVREGVEVAYVAMAPSTELRLDPELEWRYGIKGRPRYSAALTEQEILANLSSRRVWRGCGTKDVLAKPHTALDSSPEAMSQGTNRIERFWSFKRYLKRFPTWEKQVSFHAFDGLGHNSLGAYGDPAVVDFMLHGDANLAREHAAKCTVDPIEEAMAARDERFDAEWLAVPDRAAFDAKCTRFKEDFRKAIGYHEIVRTPLNAKTMGVKDYGAFRIEKAMIESAPGEFVPLLVFLPDAAKFSPPYAGFVFIPGHSDSGKGAEAYLHTCELGARHGLVSVIYDPLGQGERSQGAGLRGADEHVRIGAYAALVGETTATYMLRDALRVLDYLEGRPDIDRARLGACGNSGGGTLSAFFMVAEDRIKAATPSCYLSSVREQRLACGPQDSEQNFFDEAAWGFNHAALVLSAGCPVLINAAVEDYFQIGGSRATYKVVKDVAAKVGLPDGWYALSEAPGKHAMSKVHREQAIRFLLKHLNGECRDVVETETTDFTKADIVVTPDGEVSHLAGFRPVYDDILDKFVVRDVSVEQAAKNARPLVARELAGADCREVLATLKGNFEKGTRATLRIGDAAKAGEATATFFAEGPRFVPRPLRRGHWDPQTRKSRFSYYERRRDDEVVAVDLYIAGRSLVALRAAELLTLSAEIKRRTGLAPALVAKGRFATVAKFALAAASDAFAEVEFLDEPKPFLEALKARDYLSLADSGALFSGRP